MQLYQYVTSAGKQQMIMYYSLGQKVPSVIASIPLCHAASLIAPMGEEGINFTGVSVMLNSDSHDACAQVIKEKRRYRKKCPPGYQPVRGAKSTKATCR